MPEDVLTVSLWFAIAYLFGSLNTAKILTNLFKIGSDISRLGTKNAGAYNTILCFGLRWGVLVFLFDAGRGVLLVFAGKLLGLSMPVILASTLFAIVGHNWPIFFKFRGGKSIAITGGMLFALNPVVMALLIPLMVFSALPPMRLFPLAPILVIPIFTLWTYGLSGQPEIYGLFSAMLIIIFLRRIHAEWKALRVASSKILALKNLLLYDRTTNDPPPFTTIFKKHHKNAAI